MLHINRVVFVSFFFNYCDKLKIVVKRKVLQKFLGYDMKSLRNPDIKYIIDSPFYFDRKLEASSCPSTTTNVSKIHENVGFRKDVNERFVNWFLQFNSACNAPAPRSCISCAANLLATYMQNSDQPKNSH